MMNCFEDLEKNSINLSQKEKELRKECIENTLDVYFSHITNIRKIEYHASFIESVEEYKNWFKYRLMEIQKSLKENFGENDTVSLSRTISAIKNGEQLLSC